MPEYLFSQFHRNEFEALHKELSKVFNITQGQLQDCYEVMQQYFKGESNSRHIPSLPRNIFYSCEKKFQKRYEEAFVIGVDIPSILDRTYATGTGDRLRHSCRIPKN
ncbi:MULTISPECIES: hypothetical protein [Calothrix]|uniref:Uncharacterized protein n=2 Tax=Calothrix TaxID=1186 RepID=A0ABR8AHI9_9CYAN|nr:MULTISPECIES: hypothetical protein [Calothrix]MBD2199396.1 hypothetical protein [Calothrix parietina FACHB-288]MBD2228197.1 hypothetical protein [Calothrix anomala FACHB-343]